MIANALRAAEAARLERVELDEAADALTDLLAYLTSPKFREDPTVQVADVMSRLQPVRSAILGADHTNREVLALLAPKRPA